jgi:hypothetical protein
LQVAEVVSLRLANQRGVAALLLYPFSHPLPIFCFLFFSNRRDSIENKKLKQKIGRGWEKKGPLVKRKRGTEKDGRRIVGNRFRPFPSHLFTNGFIFVAPSALSFHSLYVRLVSRSRLATQRPIEQL